MSTSTVTEEAEDEENPRLVHLSLGGVDMWTVPELFQGDCCVHWPEDGAGGKATSHSSQSTSFTIVLKIILKTIFLGAGLKRMLPFYLLNRPSVARAVLQTPL